MLIRREAAGDEDAIAAVHRRAFAADAGGGEPIEVTLVEQLRRCDAWLPTLSLVALVDDVIVGHVVCTRAMLEAHQVLGLGPVGVDPAFQGRGFGAALMHAVLGAAEALDEPLVGLLGEPAYYRRFGFVAASALDIEAPDPGWGDAFQARPLAAYTPQLRGPFVYAVPFHTL